MKKLVRLWDRPSKRSPRGFVYVLLWYEDGKQRMKSLGHCDARKAKQQQAKKEQELRLGEQEVVSMTLRDLLHDYTHSTQGQVVPTTLNHSIHDLTELMKVIGNKNIMDVTYKDGERLIKHCLGKGNRPATVNKKLRHIHRVFELAVKRRQLEVNPFRGLGPLRVTPRPIIAFSDDEIELLVENAPDLIWQARIRMARSAGMRIGELLNLTWDDIHMNQLLVVVQPKDDSQDIWSWTPKDYEIRELPLDEQTVDLLRRVRLLCPSTQPYALLRPETYTRMIQNHLKGQLSYAVRRIPEREYSKEFKRIVKKAGLSSGTMHDLRRTAITTWAENPNLQPHEVMKLAGHSSLETTMKHYVHFRRSLVDRARGGQNPLLNSNFVAHL